MTNRALIDQFKQSLQGKDHLTYENGSYLGEVRSGLRQGKGVLEFSNGAVYCGYFRDDLPNG